MTPSNLLIKPIITEKSTRLANNHQYTFAVARPATKTQIKEAIQAAFKVTVLKVNTKINSSSTVRRGSARREVSLPGAKIAIVTLKSTDKIDLFETKETKAK